MLSCDKLKLNEYASLMKNSKPNHLFIYVCCSKNMKNNLRNNNIFTLNYIHTIKQ